MGALQQQLSSFGATDPWWKVAGITAVGAYAPKGSASLAASYTNLANNAVPIAPGVAPTWNATDGWIFNGTTQYLDTSLTPVGVTQAWSMFIRYSSLTGGDANTTIIGVGDGAGSWFMIQPNGVDYRYGGETGPVGGGLATGVLGIAGNQGYRNGIAEGGVIPPAAVTYPTIIVGGTNYRFTGAIFLASVKVQAVAIYSGVLNDTQAAALTTALNAL